MKKSSLFPYQLVSGDTSATAGHPREEEQNYKYINS